MTVFFKRKNGGFLEVLQLLGWICAAASLAIAWQPAAAFEIVPHRAAYTFKVVDIDSQSGIADVQGGMTFEWADACDGWALDQRYLLRITSEDGKDLVSQSSSVSWESKDGRRMRFTTKREHDGVVTNQFSGDAKLDKAGGSGTVHFTLPQDMTIKLLAGTRFPTNMTLFLMAAAARGQRNFEGFIFEGGELAGAQPFTALILPQRPPRHKGILKGPLGPYPIWPMYVAYYKTGGGDDVPETEIAMDVQENGIVPEFTVNYGTFKLRATLERIEALPPVKC